MVDNLTKMTADVNVISKLDNYPPDDPGMTPSKLKGLFDEGSNTIKDFINNTLIEEINPFLEREILRDSAEANRVSAENARAEAEEERETAESARISREEARQTAESARISREEARQTAESARVSHEEARQNAEGQRELNEEERIRNEGYRNENEYDRETAEGLRVSAESGRVSAENERASTFSGYDNRIRTIEDGESTRVQSESIRVSAENARASAEQARVNAENARSVFEVYNPGKSYVVGNKVYYLGSSYRCIKNSSGVAPTNTECWMIIARKGEVYFPTFSVDENMQLIMHDDFNYDGTISFRLNNGYLIQEVV
jgi:hypothetical protein